MNALIDTFQYIVLTIQHNMPLVLMMLAGLWLFNLVNWLILGGRLNIFGIVPRKISGLIGIFFAPFLHGNFNHLFFNTIPLFMLLNFILTAGLHQFFCISLSIMVLSGLAVWLFGRPAIHIGASSLIMGYWGYLLANAYQQPTAFSIVLAIVTLYYFAGLIFNLFPSDEKVSWEGHLFGALSGIATTFICPKIVHYIWVANFVNFLAI